MGVTARVILFNADESYGPQLRTGILQLDGVKIVAEVDEPLLLAQAAKQFPADVVIVNLDPNPQVIVAVAGQVAAELPELAVFAVSESTDGQLILSAMRSGIREFLTKPIEPDVLGAALEKVTRQRVSSAPQGRLISVMGSAGGVGSTTIATNLAVELADLSPGGVALVDLDFRFGQVATMLDVESTFTIADLCESHEHLEPQVIERALVRHGSGVSVLPRPNAFAQAENITAAHCVGVLSGLLNLRDYVIVDGPTRFDSGAKAVLDLADDVFLVLHLVVPCVRNVSRMLDGLRQVGFNLERVKLICNRTGRDSGNLSIHDVKDTLRMDVYAALPDDWAALSGATNLGEPLAVHAPKSKARVGFLELARRIYQPDADADEIDVAKKGGLLSKIFSDA